MLLCLWFPVSLSKKLLPPPSLPCTVLSLSVSRWCERSFLWRLSHLLQASLEKETEIACTGVDLQALHLRDCLLTVGVQEKLLQRHRGQLCKLIHGGCEDA